jgi:hypothetical protein
LLLFWVAQEEKQAKNENFIAKEQKSRRRRRIGWLLK